MHDRYAMNQIATAIVDSAICVHKSLGPGLLESIYEECLKYELEKRGILVERQFVTHVFYDDTEMKKAMIIDLLVAGCVVVEIKCVDNILDVHRAQLLSYLRIGNFKLGLLLNFKTVLLKHGIVRIVNGF